MRSRFAGSRRGLTVPEVLVVLVIVGFLTLVLLMALPRQREVARFAGCRANLSQIGIALALYDQAAGHLPLSAEGPDGSGPLRALLDELAVPDFTQLGDAKSAPRRGAKVISEERPVPGFVCASDPHATAGRFRAPVSYRATTGSSPFGREGAFAPGRRVALAEIEAGDGLSFTASFAERLSGDGRSQTPAAVNYALVPAPLPEAGCPPAADSAWRGDAGSSWRGGDWRSTLYNHALLPNGAPSCLAADGRSAFMGASSGHIQGVNVLLCDGGVRAFTPQVDVKIWREWAAFPSAARP